MKRDRIIFWVATTLIVLFEGVMPAFTFQSELAKEGIRHLGYPEYFGVYLAAFKVLGAITLIIPRISWRLKEWAYAGFAIDFISATISHVVIDGPVAMSFFPLIVLAVLAVSYVFYHKTYATVGKIR